MKRAFAVFAASMVLIVGAVAQEFERVEPVPEQPVRFEAVHVYVDSGEVPLAAYQFEMAAHGAEVRIVGIEGGEHPAFQEPPYYDTAALMKRRVIIADFNTGAELPTGRTRVARVHVQVTGEREPEYVLKLHVAASKDGKPISATVTSAKGEAK